MVRCKLSHLSSCGVCMLCGGDELLQDVHLENENNEFDEFLRMKWSNENQLLWYFNKYISRDVDYTNGLAKTRGLKSPKLPLTSKVVNAIFKNHTNC